MFVHHHSAQPETGGDGDGFEVIQTREGFAIWHRSMEIESDYENGDFAAERADELAAEFDARSRASEKGKDMGKTHKPGPWGVNNLAAGGELAFTAPDGRAVPVGYIVQSGSQPIAACIESHSDALLIAAAPVMLAAGRRVLEWVDSGCDPSAKSIEALRTAIAAATGTPTDGIEAPAPTA